jgi:hypothetical protein
VVEVDKTWLSCIAIGMWVAAIFFSMAAVVAECAPLQELAAVGKMPVLIAPVATIYHAMVICNLGLSDKPLILQDFCCH